MYGRQVALADVWEHGSGREIPSRGPMEPCAALWCAVIEVAIQDAWRGPGGTMEERYRRGARDRARFFLRGHGPGLPYILDLIRIDRDWWAQKLLPELERQWRAYDAGLVDVPRKVRVGRGPAPRRAA